MRLMVTAYTPVGTFTGQLNDRDAPREALEKTRDHVQSSVMNYFVIYMDDGELTLNKELIANSALHFKIVE